MFRTLLTLLFFIAASAASAHAPFISEATPTSLPDGRPATMALLNGDGLFLADPKRVVLFDGARNLLALGPKTGPITFLCGDGACVAYDHWNGLIHAPNGGIADVAMSMDDLGELENSGKAWGFDLRRPTWGERLRGEAGLAQKLPGAMLTLGLLGLLATVVTYAAWRGFRRLRLWIGAPLLLTGVGAAGLLLLVALYVVLLVGMSSPTLFAGLASGAVLAGAGICGISRRRAV